MKTWKEQVVERDVSTVAPESPNATTSFLRQPPIGALYVLRASCHLWLVWSFRHDWPGHISTRTAGARFVALSSRFPLCALVSLRACHEARDRVGLSRTSNLLMASPLTHSNVPIHRIISDTMVLVVHTTRNILPFMVGLPSCAGRYLIMSRSGEKGSKR